MINAVAVKMVNIYGAKTTISRVGVHEYLGMELDFVTCPDTLIISIIRYLQKIIDEFPEVLSVTKACPAGDYLIQD